MAHRLLCFFFFSAFMAGTCASLLLFSGRGRFFKSRYLGIWMAGLAASSLSSFWLQAGGHRIGPELFFIWESAFLLAAPCSCLYVGDVLHSHAAPRRCWMHFLPFFIYFSFNAIACLDAPAELEGTLAVGPAARPFCRIFMASACLFYAFVLSMLIARLKKRKQSDLSSKFSGWIRTYSILCLALFLSLLAGMAIDPGDGISGSMGPAAVLLCAAMHIYFSPHVLENRQKGLCSGESASGCRKGVRTKAGFGELAGGKKRDYLSKLDDVMQSQKPFLKKEITIKELSAQTDIAPTMLYSLIDTEYGLNFNDYINKKRVEYFIEKFQDPDWRHLSLEGMAKNCGFGSRTSCFRSFIRHTGMPPSKYLEGTKGKTALGLSAES